MLLALADGSVRGEVEAQGPGAHATSVDKAARPAAAAMQYESLSKVQRDYFAMQSPMAAKGQSRHLSRSETTDTS